MNITGIIAEYNPFHNGHAWHLQEARRITNSDYIIVVMSGDFVQRGEPAIIDKFTRTKMALLNGADLVIELPVRHACASAEYFARGAVQILNDLGCVTHLCFGSECADLSLIKETSEFLLSESEVYRTALRQALKSGCSFPKAREQAFFACGYAKHASLLGSPNNILAVEYCRALSHLHSHMEPVTILRRGGSYHSTDASLHFSSATAIRTSIVQEHIAPTFNVPENVSNLLSLAHGHSYPITANDFSALLHYQLLSAKDWQTLSNYFDVPPDLAKRMFRLRYAFQDFNSFAALLKTKNITELSVRRALTHILLGLKENTHHPCYARILGFRKEAAPLFNELKQTASLPLITKPAASAELLWEDLFASQIYHSIATQKYGAAPYEELRQPLVLI